MAEYVPFNYFSFQSPDNYDGKYHSMKYIFSEEELATKDDTLRVVDEIENKIKQCGEMLAKRDWFTEEYDEDGNIKEDCLEDNNGKEHDIKLVGFPGVFVKKEYFNQFVKPLPSDHGKNELPDGYVDLLINQSYKGKVPMKLVVHPDTFWGDHYRDLLGEGIDAEKDYIFGVVDIDLLCKTLYEKGINISFVTTNFKDIQREHERRLALLFKKYSGPNNLKELLEEVSKLNKEIEELSSHTLDLPSTSQYLDNLNKTQMLSSVTVTIPFSNYLKNHKNKSTAYTKKYKKD